MLQNSLMGGRTDGLDRYRNWRVDADNMSYENFANSLPKSPPLQTKVSHLKTACRSSKNPFVNNKDTSTGTWPLWTITFLYLSCALILISRRSTILVFFDESNHIRQVTPPDKKYLCKILLYYEFVHF